MTDAIPSPAPDAETRFGVALDRSTSGQLVGHVGRDAYLGVVKAAKGAGFVHCVDLTAVDYLTAAPRPVPDGVVAERFEVVVVLRNLVAHERVRLRVQVPEADPRVASLYAVHGGTEAMEREVYDLLGISFDGHPDLTRILMPDDWEGHPLRKDYAIGRIPVQFSPDFSPRP
jgi:NADH-quinone oxidoreductase subunit C